MHVVLIAAQSLDGYITRHDDPGTAFTSAADRDYFPAVLASFDCSVMGSTTYRVWSEEHGGRTLDPGRRRCVLTREPERYADAAVAGLLEFSAEAPPALVDRLAALGHRACALLGGGQVHHAFLTAGLVDELWVTLEPRLFGDGTRLVAGRLDVTLTLLSADRLQGSDSLLVKYRVNRLRSFEAS